MTASPATKDGATFKYVLSIIDVMTRFLWLTPLPSKVSGLVADALKKLYVEFQWGPPCTIQSDQGTEFKGAVKELCDKIGVRVIYSAPYHPQSQGKVRISRDIFIRGARGALPPLEF